MSLPARAQRVGLGVALALGLLDAWRYIHYQANPDGVSYLDIARAFAAHGPAALANGYWSPLLPALVGVAYRVLPPTVDTMYPIAHVVTFLSFVACALTFHRLLFVLRHRLGPDGGATVRAVALVAVGWAAFVLMIEKGIGVQLITPDMGVAAVVFWFVAEAFSLGDGAWAPRRWAVTGAVAAVGYWWKAILFPVALVWLGCASLLALRRRDGMRGPAAGWLAFVALAAVVAVPVSVQVGRATFGETGRLNYLWYVDAAPYVWERCVAPEGLDATAARFGGVARDSLIATRPVTCAIEGRTPEATMPLWYDPSVYYRATHARFDAPSQWRAVRNNIGYVVTGAAEYAPTLLLALAMLAVAMVARAARLARGGGGGSGGGAPIAPRDTILVPFVVAPVAFYLVVYVEFRHVAPFFLAAGMLGVLAAARTPGHATTAALGAVVAAAMVDVAWRLATPTLVALALARSTLAGRAGERIPDTQVAARALATRLPPGTRVASVYDAWNAEWAQLAGLRIRAHVPDVTTSLPAVLAALRDACALAAWDAALRARTIGAVVANIPNGLAAPPGFDRIAGTTFHLHLTGPPADTATACRAGRS
ncbi:MAG TPA: hypothetical protein VG916_13650 [Gemmatimonadaceae bacterium]|nr:hypothetical protein [Gemmatimonadaceae bacterium]